MEMQLDRLDKIIYALTLADRPLKRHLWLAKGFQRFNAKPGSLLRYWERRLSKGAFEDMQLYHSTLAKYIAATAPTEPQRHKKEMAGSALNSAAGWIRSGLKLAPADVVEFRHNTCRSCEFWDASALRNTGRCTKCGCSTWAKIKMATESCPVGHWKEVA